jgi:hypothetical protein
VIEALIGAAVGVLTIVLARFIHGERWLYSLGLLTLPSIYAFFALQAGQQAVGVKEMIYGVPYVVAGLVFAFVSIRQSAVVVAIFWLLHGLYDLVHSQLITNTGVPGWYPIFCFVVDAVIGAYLLWLSRRVPNANLRQA